MGLIIDGFAGGGGASLGIHWAMGRSPDIAINHDEAAIAMHEANHPETLHVRDDIWNVRMKKLVGRKAVDLAWLSPACTHFSRARGGTPVTKQQRSMAWVACKWAQEIRPKVIFLENVVDFMSWGPIVPIWKCRDCTWKGTEGQATLMRVNRKCPLCESKRLQKTEDLTPCPNKKGLTFKRFVGRLRNLGYNVEWRSLDAADYGAPTRRKRLFLVARRDGKPIVWPEPTHGDPKKLDDQPLFDRLKPWRTAAECIDWSIPCPSIFERKRPLKDATLRRIALGLKRYVIDAEKPFIVQLAHGEGLYGRWGSGSKGVDEPIGTVTGSNNHAVVTPILTKYHGQKGDESRCKELDEPFNTLDTQPRFGLVSPIIAPITHSGERRCNDPTEPLPTITSAKRGELAVIAPILERQFSQSACASADAPAPTTTAGGGGKTAIVAATLVQTGYGEREGQAPRALDIEAPHGTVVAGGAKTALVAAHLTKFRTGSDGQSVEDPMPTVTANSYVKRPGGCAPIGVVSAFIAKHYGGMVGVEAETPLPTTTGKGCQNQVVAASLVHMNHGEKQWSSVEEPLRTVTSNNHAAMVYAFMCKYYGTAVGQGVDEPLGTATTKDRFGLVTVTVDGEPYVIVDIGMRMLTPRELARAQGFPEEYILTGTKTSQVARIGNSVVPQMAEVLVRANLVLEMEHA